MSASMYSRRRAEDQRRILEQARPARPPSGWRRAPLRGPSACWNDRGRQCLRAALASRPAGGDEHGEPEPRPSVERSDTAKLKASTAKSAKYTARVDSRGEPRDDQVAIRIMVKIDEITTAFVTQCRSPSTSPSSVTPRVSSSRERFAPSAKSSTSTSGGHQRRVPRTKPAPWPRRA